MSQEQIIQWLESHPNQKFTARQLHEYLGIGLVSTHINLRKIRHLSRLNNVRYAITMPKGDLSVYEMVYWMQK